MPIFEKNGQIIGETGRILVFLVFTVPPLSPVHFGQIFSKFIFFFSKIDKIGEVRFSSSTEFSNTAEASQRCAAAYEYDAMVYGRAWAASSSLPCFLA
jgi:hypothetical protein